MIVKIYCTNIYNKSNCTRKCVFDEIVNNPDYDEEDRALAAVNASIYGSVEEEYFEIDYFIGDIPCEIYIAISEQ